MAKSNNPEATLGKNKSSAGTGATGPRSSGKANDSSASRDQSGSASKGKPEGLKSEGKSNHETATLRSGNLPKPEAVRTAKCDVGAAVRCAQKQNTSDGGDYAKKRNVIPNESDESLVAVGVVKVKE